VLLIAVLSGARRGSGSEAPSFRIHIRGRSEAASVQAALEGAAARLERPECRQLFADFTDALGRPLQANLDALADTPARYLGLVLFQDGQADRRCSGRTVLAFTAPASRVVFVCSSFATQQRRDQGLAEVVLLHEVLHTLGLGENPPLSTEITARVAARCGR
jgi:hypothetical protein